MADNLKGIPFGNDDEGIDFPTMAKRFVLATYNGTQPLMEKDIYVVWFCYILGGWKALCSTKLPDGRYYEVTHKPEHDGSDGPSRTFVDTYVKVKNEEYTKTDG